MKSKLLVSIFIGLLFAGIVTAGMNISRVSADPTTLFIDPSSVAKTPANVGSTFVVSVNISSVTDLFGFDINITWDNTLITFSSLDNTTLSIVFGSWFEPLNGSKTGVGSVRFAAVKTGMPPGFTGSGTLFKLTFNIVKGDNFPHTTSIAFDTVKLSDSSAGEITAMTTPCSYTMSATTPDLEFEFIGTNSTKFGATFQIKVNATDCYNLDDYNLTILYDHSLLSLTSVDWTDGVLGGTSDQASFTESPLGTINVLDTGGFTWTGTKGLLFTLAFKVNSTGDTKPHIWRQNNLGPLYAFIKLDDATLSFVGGGTIAKTGITMPSDLHIVVTLVQGDINLDGSVDAVSDLRTVAIFYDKTSTDPQWNTGYNISQYDLKPDNVIDIFDLVLVATQIH